MDTCPIPSFPKIWHLGSPEVSNLFTGWVEVTEKIDGSQFAFGKLVDGTLVMRSKGRQVYPETADALFKPVIAWVESISHKITPGVTYYGETLSKTRQNTLNYQRVPKSHFVLFGVRVVGRDWVNNRLHLVGFSEGIGCDVVPEIFAGEVRNEEHLKEMLTQESYLGGETIEGVVIKNYNQLACSAFSRECFAKLVREEFKERNHAGHPNKTDRMETFLAQFATEARWKKAVQHLKERGELTQSPKDIGSLIKEVKSDLLVEEKQFIMEQGYKLIERQVLEASVKGVAEWYKDQLLKTQFGN